MDGEPQKRQARFSGQPRRGEAHECVEQKKTPNFLGGREVRGLTSEPLGRGSESANT